MEKPKIKEDTLDAGHIATGTIKADVMHQSDIVNDLKREIEKLKAGKIKAEEDLKTLQAQAGNEIGKLNITIDTLIAKFNRK